MRRHDFGIRQHVCLEQRNDHPVCRHEKDSRKFHQVGQRNDVGGRRHDPPAQRYDASVRRSDTSVRVADDVVVVISDYLLFQ
ncbi:hypothetical protein H8B06_09565 [Sphingobacterium sp. DN00404]|uniref:Uncharacterized protein n=1 Tax=Sphingobacterium micropteri TaxID=2763501 RepID=A0ABR7YPB2_9SPHI|nr:hypothetical protein [Sphingobacterium micropteri]MBD1433071.1 hypothetical protein [Sphingobacterium micropteri]